MIRAARAALLVAALLAVAGCPEDQAAGTGPLADGYLAKAKTIERALARLEEQLASADRQLADGAAHVSFEPLHDRDLPALRDRLDQPTRAAVDQARDLARSFDAALDELSRTPAREKPSPARLDELRAQVKKAASAARAARERLASYIGNWS